MTLQHDADGFLLGETVPDLKRLAKNMDSIRKDVAMIKNYLNESLKNQASNEPPRSNVERLRDANGRFTRRETAEPNPIEQTQLDLIRQLNSEAAENQVSSEPSSPSVERLRNANGRFTRRETAEPNSNGNQPDSNEKNEGRESLLSNAVDKLGDKLDGVLTESANAMAEISPDVKAMQEVAELLAQGYKFLFGSDDDKRDKKYFDWLKKIWKSLTQKDSASDGGAGGGFVSSLVTSIMGGGLFAALGSILALIFSPVALGIGTAGVLAWGLFTKSGNRFFSYLTDSLLPMWKTSVDWTSKNVFEPIGTLFDSVKTTLIKTWDETVAKVSSMFEAIGKKWDELIAGGKALLDKFIVNPVKNAIDSVKENHADAVAFVSGKMEKTANAVDTVKDKTVGAYDGAVDYTSRNIVEPVGEISKAAKQKWNDKRTNSRWQEAKPLITDAAKKADVDPAILTKISGFESGFNSEAMPIAKSGKKISSAHGYGQFLDGTWDSSIKKYGAKYGLDVNNPRKYRHDKTVQANMLAEFTKENLVKGRKYGGTDDAANVYAMHNLGEGDGSKFLKALKANPNATVNSIGLGKGVVSGNPSLYKNGNITLAEAYANMGKAMGSNNAFANDIKQTQQKIEQATAKPISPAQVNLPPAPAVSIMPKPAKTEPMPSITVPLASDSRNKQAAMIIQNGIGQDLPDRKLALIATGGLSAP